MAIEIAERDWKRYRQRTPILGAEKIEVESKNGHEPVSHDVRQLRETAFRVKLRRLWKSR